MHDFRDIKSITNMVTGLGPQEINKQEIVNMVTEPQEIHEMVFTPQSEEGFQFNSISLQICDR